MVRILTYRMGTNPIPLVWLKKAYIYRLHLAYVCCKVYSVSCKSNAQLIGQLQKLCKWFIVIAILYYHNYLHVYILQILENNQQNSTVSWKY
jgi:hypothetical protein